VAVATAGFALVMPLIVIAVPKVVPIEKTEPFGNRALMVVP